MHKKWLYIIGGAALGYYLATAPNDGSNPITSIGGTVYGTIPTALGIATTPIVYGVEGAALGMLLYHFIK